MAENYTCLTAPSSSNIPPVIVRESDHAFIPLDLNNMDYQGFLAWMAEGNPAPAGWTGPTNSSPATG